jgi:hypothetical protein
METSKDLASAGSTGAIMPLAKPDAPAGIHREKKVSRLRVPLGSAGASSDESSVVIRPSLLGETELYDGFELFCCDGGDRKAIALL